MRSVSIKNHQFATTAGAISGSRWYFSTSKIIILSFQNLSETDLCVTGESTVTQCPITLSMQRSIIIWMNRLNFDEFNEWYWIYNALTIILTKLCAIRCVNDCCFPEMPNMDLIPQIRCASWAARLQIASISDLSVTFTEFLSTCTSESTDIIQVKYQHSETVMRKDLNCWSIC